MTAPRTLASVRIVAKADHPITADCSIWAGRDPAPLRTVSLLVRSSGVNQASVRYGRQPLKVSTGGHNKKCDAKNELLHGVSFLPVINSNPSGEAVLVNNPTVWQGDVVSALKVSAL